MASFKLRAYAQGVKARANHVPHANNPYAKLDEEFNKQWHDGWDDANSTLTNTNGAPENQALADKLISGVQWMDPMAKPDKNVVVPRYDELSEGCPMPSKDEFGLLPFAKLALAGAWAIALVLLGIALGFYFYHK